jgi:integrase
VLRDLNDAFLRTLRPPATGRVEIRDARTPNLLLRVTARSMVWTVRAWTRDGKRTNVSIGRYPAVGLAEARKRALATLAAIHRGADPIAEKRTARAEREARRTAPTVADRLEQWQHAKAGRWSDRHAREVARIAAREIVPALGTRPLAETGRADWTALVERKRRAGAPVAASLLLRIASAFLTYAEASGWIERSPLPRRAAATLAPLPAARERTLADAELAALWRASAALAPKTRAIVRLLILTGARRAEVGGLALGELDLEAGRWTLPAARAKNRRPLVRPLGPLALAELRAVLPAGPVAPTWRIFGRVGAGPYAGWSKLKRRLDELAPELGAWRWHDLRRTVRTGLARLGVDRDTAELALGHVSHRSKVEQVYDRSDPTPAIAAALLRWHAHVVGLVGGAEAAAILPLRHRAA